MGDILGFTVKSIDDKEVALESLRGKVLLVVNVASACGFTPQYAGLEKLHRALAPRGVSVLGFPSNDFGAQEPGTEAQIKEFCSTRFDVTFPMFSKVKVKGPDAAPLYRALGAAAGEPQWNFHKYLVGKDGRVVKAFRSNVAPESKELLDAIEAALAA
mgnify:CR=1 FL=1